jgi:hypothetical protein
MPATDVERGGPGGAADRLAGQKVPAVDGGA